MSHKYKVKHVTTEVKPNDYKRVGVFYADSIASIVRTISTWGASGASPAATEVERIHSGWYNARHHNGFVTAFYIERVY